MELQQRQSINSPCSDEQIISLYWSRNENAIKETDVKYRNYLVTIAFHIVYDTHDSEECLNDTYLAVWNAIPPARPNVLKAFLTTIIRRISINRYHSNQRHSEMTVSLSELEDFLSEDKSISDRLDVRELGRAISNAVRSLSERRRFIFMSRYYAAEPIDVIAKELHLSRSMVNKELASIRKALKEKLESEGYSI